MPGIKAVITKFAKQTAVYWEKVGSDPFGKPLYADPVEVKCRWEDRQREVVLPDGRKVLSHAYLLLAVPMKVGSLTFLGTLGDWAALDGYPRSPTVTQGGREVLVAKATPDLKAKSYVYEVYL